MKQSIVIAASSLVLAIVALLSVYIFTSIGRSQGEEWGSLNGPESVWPAVVGFSALWLIPISAVVLVLLIAIALVRDIAPRPRSHD